MGTGSFPEVKSGRGVTLTPQSLLVPWSRKSRAIPLLPLWAVRPVQSLSACTRVPFTFPFISKLAKKEGKFSLEILHRSFILLFNHYAALEINYISNKYFQNRNEDRISTTKLCHWNETHWRSHKGHILPVFRHVREIAKSKYWLRHICLSVARLPVRMEQLGSHGRDLLEI